MMMKMTLSWFVFIVCLMSCDESFGATTASRPGTKVETSEVVGKKWKKAPPEQFGLFPRFGKKAIA